MSGGLSNLGQREIDRPGFQTPLKTGPSDAQMIGPSRQGHLLSIEGDQCSALILALLKGCRPPTISWLVIAVHIDAVDGKFR